MIAVQIVLYHLHRFELLYARFFGYLVFAFIGIVLKMSYIGYVAYITHFIAEVTEIAVKNVECYGRTCMSEMTFAIYCRTAYIHAYTSFMYWYEAFFVAGNGVVYRQVVLFHS